MGKARSARCSSRALFLCDCAMCDVGWNHGGVWGCDGGWFVRIGVGGFIIGLGVGEVGPLQFEGAVLFLCGIGFEWVWACGDLFELWCRWGGGWMVHCVD